MSNNKQSSVDTICINENYDKTFTGNMSNNKELSLVDALCIVKTGWRTEQEKELLDNAYLLIKQHSEILHLEYQKQCIEEKLTEIKGGNNE